MMPRFVAYVNREISGACCDALPYVNREISGAFCDALHYVNKESSGACCNALPYGTRKNGVTMVHRRGFIEAYCNALHTVEGKRGQPSLLQCVACEEQGFSRAYCNALHDDTPNSGVDNATALTDTSLSTQLREVAACSTSDAAPSMSKRAGSAPSPPPCAAAAAALPEPPRGRSADDIRIRTQSFRSISGIDASIAGR